MKPSTLTPYAAATLVAMLIGVLLFASSNGITGMFTAEDNVTVNHVPGWTGETSFTINGTLDIDLASHFFDPDFDTLTYLANAPAGLTVTIDGSTLQIAADPSFDHATLTVYASDGIDLGQADLTVTSANAQTTPTPEPTPPANETPPPVNESAPLEQQPLVTNVSQNASNKTGIQEIIESFSIQSNISTCGNLSAGLSTLGNDVTSAGLCFNITSDNATLDCNGTTITYDTSGQGNTSGVLAYGHRNITVRNCLIQDGNNGGSSGIGINFTNMSASLIFNNTIQSNGTGQSVGVLLRNNTRFTAVVNNTVQTNGTNSVYGVFLLGNASFNNVTGNFISVYGFQDTQAVRVENESNNVLISNNTLLTDGALLGTNPAIMVTTFVNDTNIIGNFILTGGGAGVNHGAMLQLEVAHATVANNTIRVGGASGVGVSISNGAHNVTVWGNIIITNGSSGSAGNTGVSVNSPANGTLIVYNDITTYGQTSGQDGINLVAVSNNTVAHNFIRTNGTAGSNYGIYLLTTANDNVVWNNTINTSSTSGGSNFGIYLLGNAVRNNVSGNVIRTGVLQGSTNNAGIRLESGGADGPLFNQIQNNSIMANGSSNSNHGIHLQAAVGQNNITGNMIFTFGTDSNDGIHLSAIVQNVTFENNTIVSNGSGTDNHGIRLTGGGGGVSSNTFRGNTITSEGGSGIFLFTNAMNNTFVRTTITTATAGTYGIVASVAGTNYSQFNDTVIISASEEWMSSTGSINNFSNTTFRTGNGSARFPGQFFLNGTLIMDAREVNISFNKAKLNTSGLPFFNTSSFVTFSGLSFIRPFAVVNFTDGTSFVTCPADVCTNISYDGSTFAMNVSHWTIYSTQDIPGNSTCGTITQSSVLNQSVSSTGTCMQFGADNIFLDCNGSIIYFDNAGTGGDYGVLAQNRTNVTIRNCVILDNKTDTGASKGAIRFDNTNDSLIYNVSTMGNGTSSNFGLSLLNSSRNRINASNFSLKTSGDSSYDVLIEYSSQNNITGNNLIHVFQALQPTAQDNLVSTNGSENLIAFNNMTIGDIAVTSNSITVTNDIGSIFSNNNLQPSNPGKGLTASGARIIARDNIITGGQTAGIEFSSATFSAAINNTITAQLQGSAIVITGSNSNNITSNTIRGTGPNAQSTRGISVSSGPNDNIRIENNSIVMNGTTDNYGILVIRLTNSTIRGNSIATNGTLSHAIGVSIASSNDTISDNILTVNTPSSAGINLLGGNHSRFINNTFVNMVQWIQLSNPNEDLNFTNNTFVTGNGTMRFTGTGTVNFSSSLNVSASVLNMSFNRIFVNTTNVSFLNTSAFITLAGVNFILPLPTVDFNDTNNFVTCPANTCTRQTSGVSTAKFNVSHFTGFGTQEGQSPFVGITACTNLSGTNTAYILLNNVSSNSTCFTVQANNITLDCNGTSIFYGNISAGSGVVVDGIPNATIRNCLITDQQGGQPDSSAINLTFAMNVIILNNTLLPNGTTGSYGISMFNSHNSTIDKNYIATSGNGSNHGIALGSPIARFDVVSPDGSINNPVCGGNFSGNIQACKVCFATPGVDCTWYGRKICQDGKGYKYDTLVNFTLTTIPQSARIQILGGELVDCYLNNNFLLHLNGEHPPKRTWYGRGKQTDSCGEYGAANIPGSYFVAGFNNLTCRVSGSGAGTENGFKLSEFSFIAAALNGSSDNRFVNNTVTAVNGGNNSNALHVTDGSNRNYFADNSFNSTSAANGTAVLVMDSEKQAFYNTSLNYTLNGIDVVNDLNQFFNGTVLGGEQPLTLETFDGDIAFTTPLDLTNGTNLSVVVNITLNGIGINTTHPFGQALNHPALLSFKNIYPISIVPSIDPGFSGSFNDCSDDHCTIQDTTASVFVYNVTGFSNYSTRNITTCAEIDLPGYFQLSTNLSANDTCFIIYSDNVTVDCAGNHIDYATGAQGYAFQIENATNITVQDCIITQNNTFFPLSDAIHVVNASNISLVRDQISTLATASLGALLHSVAGFVVNDTSIKTTGSTSPAINGTDTNQTFIAGGHFLSSSQGLFIEGTAGNYTNITVNSSATAGIFVNGAGHALFANINLSSTGTGLTVNGTASTALSNLLISATNAGLTLAGASASITTANVSSTGSVGINATGGASLSMSSITITASSTGLLVVGSNSTTLTGGNITSSGNEAISILGGNNTVLTGLTANASRTAIVTNANNVLVDCGGRLLAYGSGNLNDTNGLNYTGLNNLTIQNCVVRRVNNGGVRYRGIAIFGASNVSIINNTIITNGSRDNVGIWVKGTQAETGTVRLVDSPLDVVNLFSITPRCTGIAGNCSLRFSNSSVAAPITNACGSGGTNYIYQTLLLFNTTTAPTGGRVVMTGGEIVRCTLNNNLVTFDNQRPDTTFSFTNDCSFIADVPLPASSFVVGQNNFTCAVRGSGRYTPTGFMLNEFEYDAISSAPPVRYTIANNTIIATGGNESHGILLEAANSTIRGNNITVINGNLSHAIFMDTQLGNNTFIDNIIQTNTSRSYGLYVIHSNGNRFHNTTFVGVPRAAVYLDNALDNVFNATFIPGPGSLVIYDTNFTLNFTQSLNITQEAALSQLMRLSGNRIFVNTTAPAGAAFNRTANLIFSAINFTGALPTVDLADTGTFSTCDSPRCTGTRIVGGGQTYLREPDGRFSYNVTGFTTYSLQETTGCRTYDLDDNVTNLTLKLDHDLSSNLTCLYIYQDNITVDCNNFYVVGTSSGDGLDVGTSTNVVKNVAIRNCNLFGFFYNIEAYSNNSHFFNNTLMNASWINLEAFNGYYNNITDNRAYNAPRNNIRETGGLSNITNNVVVHSGQYGLEIVGDFYRVTNNSLARNGVASFTVEAYNGAWQTVGQMHFLDRYSDQTLHVPAGTARIRLTQSGTDTAHIDLALLDGAAPASANDLTHGITHPAAKLAERDNDIIDADNRTTEFVWAAPGSTFRMVAVEANNGGAPINWPSGGTYSYTLAAPQSFTSLWEPMTAHPRGPVELDFSTTASDLTARLDMSADNTLDPGGDWAELRIVVGNNAARAFRVTNDNATWGTSSYEYTPLVSWQHKTYNFTIPLSELNASPGDEIRWQLGYYGTSAVAPNGGIIVNGFFTSTSNNTVVNNSLNGDYHGIVVFGSGADNLIENNTMTAHPNDGIIVQNGFAGSPDRNNLTRNIITNSSEGILFDGATIGYVTSNTLLDNGQGIRIGGFLGGGSGDMQFLNNTVMSDNISLLVNDNTRFGTSHIGMNVTNTTFGSRRDTAIWLTSGAINTSFRNTTLLSNSTWIKTDQGATLNVFQDTRFVSPNGTLRILGAFNLSNVTNVSLVRLNLSFNKIFLNSTNLTALNKSAMLTLQNIFRVNPEPTVAFNNFDTGLIPCSPPQCVEDNYNTTAFTYNVSSFTMYSSEETQNIVNISMNKSDNPDPVKLGELLNYTINITNVGNVTAINMTVSDTYPPQTTFNTSSPSPVSGTNNTFLIGNLTAGSTYSINISVRVLSNNTGGVVLNNSANLTAYNTTGDPVTFNATQSTTIQGPIYNITNISMSKTDSPDPQNITQIIRYVINLTNNGNATAYNLSVNESYPAETFFVNASPSPIGANQSRFLVGNLSAGQTVLINISLNISMATNDGVVINNTANASFSNETGAVVYLNASQNTTVLVPAQAAAGLNATLVKTDTPDPVNSSGLLNYSIAFTVNNGSAFNITVIEVYPPQARFVSASPAPLAGTNDTFQLLNISANNVSQINITVLVLNVTNGTLINNSANVTFANSSGGIFTLTATQSTTVLNPRLVNSTVTNCTVDNSTIINSVKNNCTIVNSVVTGSTNTNSTLINSNETNSTDTNSFVNNSIIINSTKSNSNITSNSTVINSTITNSSVTNSTINSSTKTNSIIINSNVAGSTNINSTLINSTEIGSTDTNTIVVNGTITNSVKNNSQINNSIITNSSLTNCIVINSTVTDSIKTNCTIINSVVLGSNNTNATIISSTERNSTDNGTMVINSTIAGSTKFNSLINSSLLNVSRVNGTNITNSSIINSNVSGSVLNNCTVINSTVSGATPADCPFINTVFPSGTDGVNITGTPASQAILSSVNASYTVTVGNNGTNANTYNLTLQNINGAATANLSQTNITLSGGSTGTITLLIGNPTSGQFNATVTAFKNTNSSLNATSQIFVTNITSVTAVNITTSATSGSATVGSSVSYTITVGNNGTSANTYNLTVQNISSADIVTLSATNITLSAGTTGTVTLDVGHSNTSGAYDATVTAFVSTNASINATTPTITTTMTAVVVPPAGGGGGGPSCTPNWGCGGWGSCVSSSQSRVCIDSNSCGSPAGMPALTQPCTCAESWICDPWTTCAPGGTATRSCVDVNSCGTTGSKPAESMSCPVPPQVQQPVQLGGNTNLRCGQVTRQNSTQVIAQRSSIDITNAIPSGYKLASPPFKLSCRGDNLDLTFQVPDSLTALRVLRCTADTCVDVSSKQVENLAQVCGNYTLRSQTREDALGSRGVLTPQNLSVFISEFKHLQPGDNAVMTHGYTFASEGNPLTARISALSVRVPYPANPSLVILGTPMVVELADASARELPVTVTLPVPLAQGVEPDSVSVYALLNGTWLPVKGIQNIIGNTIVVRIADFRAVYDATRKQAVLATVGITCKACDTAHFERQYAYPDARTAIVLIHGAFSSADTYNFMIDDFRSTNQPFDAWTFDYPSNLSVEALGQDLADALLLRANRYDNIYLVGHSAGGLIVQQALYDAYQRHDSTVTKVRKAILVGSPTGGAPAIQALRNLLDNTVTQQTLARAFNLNSVLIQATIAGKDIPRVPGVEYEVLAGTHPYDFNLGFFQVTSKLLENYTVKNDGLITVQSAQKVGKSQINNPCQNYFEVNLTHTDLIDNEAGIRVVERLLTTDFGTSTAESPLVGQDKYVRFSVNDCSPDDQYAIIGKPVPPEQRYDPTGCLCGNGWCGEGETAENCPQDCASIYTIENLCIETPLVSGVLLAAVLLIVLSFLVRHYLLRRNMNIKWLYGGSAVSLVTLALIALQNNVCKLPSGTLIVIMLIAASAYVGAIFWERKRHKHVPLLHGVSLHEPHTPIVLPKEPLMRNVRKLLTPRKVERGVSDDTRKYLDELNRELARLKRDLKEKKKYR